MEIPIYVTVSVLVAGSFAVIAVPSVVRRVREPSHDAGRLSVIVGLVLATWFALVIGLALAGVFRAAPTDVVPAPGVVLALALGGTALTIAAAPALRAILRDPTAQGGLLALHVWRLEGAAFLLLMVLGELPAAFAVPAGIGDLTIGLTAPWMARQLHRRGLTAAWNLFGLADLAIAVSLGATTSPGLLQVIRTEPTSIAITTFPMVIIPTFLVPLSIVLHVVSLYHLFSTRTRSATTQGSIPVVLKGGPR
jgi:hypothetical protein